jgi:2-dehydropantoate 2-reductase
MKIAIVGAGAIGGALAHALARAGEDVTLVARGRTAEAIARDGLRVARGGTETVSFPRVVTAPGDLAPHDLVIGALKAQDWAAAAALFEPLIGSQTCVVPAINGVPWWYFQGLAGPLAGASLRSLDADGTLSRVFPQRCLLGCVVYMAVARTSPGRLDWPTGDKLILGEIAGPGSPRLTMIAQRLRSAGMSVDETADIRGAMWMKLLSNAAFNPISVLAEATMGEILADPDLSALCAAAMGEVKAVAAAVGSPMAITVEERMNMTRHLTDFRTSTLQDFEAGRPLELAALIDAPCELGTFVGVATPVLKTIGHIIRHKITVRDRRTPARKPPAS